MVVANITSYSHCFIWYSGALGLGTPYIKHILLIKHQYMLQICYMYFWAWDLLSSSFHPISVLPRTTNLVLPISLHYWSYYPCLLSVMPFVPRRYSRHDKRSKLPGWILSHLHDAHLNLSTDMALHTAREVCSLTLLYSISNCFGTLQHGCF